MSMGAERRCSNTGWRTRATRVPPAFHPSRARLHPVSVARSSAARMSSSSVGSPKPVYSYPSCGRVRALHAILRPRIPPNRPQDAQNGRESGFPGFRSTTLDDPGWLVTQSAKDPSTGGSSGPRRSRPSSPAGGPARDQRRPDRRPRRGYARPWPPRRSSGLEHLAARRSRGGPKTQGSEGAQPPASLARGLTECGPSEYAGLFPIFMQIPA